MRNPEQYEQARVADMKRRAQNATAFRRLYKIMPEEYPLLYAFVGEHPVMNEVRRILAERFRKRFAWDEGSQRPRLAAVADARELNWYCTRPDRPPLTPSRVLLLRTGYCPNPCVKLHLYAASPEQFLEEFRGLAQFEALINQSLDSKGAGPGRVARCVFETFFKFFRENVERTGSPAGEPLARCLWSENYMKFHDGDGIRVQFENSSPRVSAAAT